MNTVLDESRRPSFGQHVRKGLGWSVVNTVTARLGSLVAGMVLARLLAPEDYGAYAVAAVVLTGVLSMNELGISLAIVRWSVDPAKIAPTVNTLALVSSAMLYVACYLGAPVLARSLNAPEAAGMIRISCICVILDGVATSAAALITKGLHQERRFLIDILGFISGTGLSVTLATIGLGGWSMIWGLVLSNLVSSVAALALAPRRFWFGFNASVAAQLLRFGGPLAGSSLLLFAMLNVDYVIVGHLLGPNSLGLYLMAFNLCSWPVSVISSTVRRVSLAAFARAAHDQEELASAFLLGLRLVATTSLGICVTLALLSEPILRLLYGEQWLPAASALSYLCVFALARILVEYAYDFFIAQNRNAFNLWLQTLWLGAMIPTLLITARLGGIEAVGLGQGAVAALIVLPVLLFGLNSHVGLTTIARSLGRPVLTCIPVAILCLAVRPLFDRPMLALVLGGVGAMAAHLAMNIPTYRALHGRPTRRADLTIRA